MTGKLNMADGAKDYDEVYDPSANTEEWNFSDLDGNTVKAETSDLHKSIFVPAGAKTIEIYHEKLGTLWAARFVEGGQLPKKLTSKWTNPVDARIAVDLYVAEQQD